MPAPRVLGLTMFTTDADITRALKADTTGHLLTADRPQVLYEAIRAAASGRTILSESVTDHAVQQMRTPPPSFSERERHILRQLAEGRANCETARALLLGETTVKSQLRRVVNGLDAQTSAAAVSTIAELRVLEQQSAPIGTAVPSIRRRCRRSGTAAAADAQGEMPAPGVVGGESGRGGSACSPGPGRMAGR